MNIYPEVEHPAVFPIEGLLKRDDFTEDVILEGQCSNRGQKPAVFWLKKHIEPMSCWDKKAYY